MVDKIWENQEAKTIGYKFKSPDKFVVVGALGTENQTETENGTWKIENNKLRVISEAVSSDWVDGIEVYELTETSLKFKVKKLLDFQFKKVEPKN